ncbi:MAG: hypothetical protein ACR5KV_06535 [Wolbachia sp.]
MKLTYLKNSERVLSGAKWIANLSQDYFASLNDNSIKPISSIRKLIEAFTYFNHCTHCHYSSMDSVYLSFFLNAVSIQKKKTISYYLK